MCKDRVWRYDREQPFSPASATPGGEFARLFFSNRPQWRAPADCGVVTAADDCYFPGVQFLALSLAGRCPLVVFDLGLTGPQREWLRLRGVDAVEVVEEDLVVPQGDSMWQAWNKPVYIGASPFEVTLWVDSDAFVVGDLVPLFDVCRHHPLVFRHVDPQIFGAVNAERLYARYPVRGSRLPGGVQNAVFGFSKGAELELVTAWGRACANFREPSVANDCRCWDQGALLWAVEDLDLSWLCRPSAGWNRFVWPNNAFGLGTIEAFFNSFAVAGDDVILHFCGRPKFWVNWGYEVPL